MRADFALKGLPDDPSAPGNAFDGAVALPMAVLLREALDHNVATMARYCAENGVLLAPHAIAWTNELFRDIGRAALQGMVELSLGRRPKGMVNPEVLERPGFQAKWKRFGGGAS